jgi:23S rRNA pseudouridine955/2504/2580 synthase
MDEINNNQVNYYTVTENDDNQRLDNLLIKILKGVPKSHLYRIIRSGEVRINKARCSAQQKVVLNDIIRIPPIRVAAKAEQNNFIPTAQFEILFEDQYFLIINKPNGIACHGGSGISFGIIEQLRKSTNHKFLELAHRLDKETSGILVLAKKRQALVDFQELSKNNKIIKEYSAMTSGVWRDDKRNVKAPITKYTLSNGERRVKVDFKEGQFAHTIFTIIKKCDNFTLVNASLQTGRTHQIRIHCQHLGYPIIGDDKYGNTETNKRCSSLGFKRMFLHARHINFTHPITNELVDITCQLPIELTNFINKVSTT